MPTTRNPRSGMCSDLTSEPLPGTAKTGGLTLALENPGGWGRDILDGEALGKELTGTISRWLKKNRAQLQFIRRPGKEGQVARDTATLFIARPGDPDNPGTPATLERMEIAGAEALTDVDLSTPGHTPGAEPVTDPLLLVCTHGKRDLCCAVKGRPLAAELAATYPGMVWESSHTKGHRFAPSMILLPWNYSFGTLSAVQTGAMLQDAAAGRLHVTGNRGRGTLGAQEQIAELAVADYLAEAGETVAMSELTVRRADSAPAPAAAEDTPEAAPAPDPAAADYAAVAASVDADLRRRAGELITQRMEMKITGRYEELKELKRQGHFQPVHEYQQAVKQAASERGVYGKYSKYNERRDKHKHKHGDHKHAKRQRMNPTFLVSDGDRSWTVTLERSTGHPVVSSCGDKQKTGTSWVAGGVRPVSPVSPGHE